MVVRCWRRAHLVWLAALPILALPILAMASNASSAGDGAGDSNQGWTVTWQDDFTDWSQWPADTGWGWSGEPQDYVPQNATIADLPDGGTAGRLTVRREASGGDNFGARYVHDEPLGRTFHDYAVTWNGKDTITWLFDGQPVARQTDAAVFRGKQYMLILNFALLTDDRWPPHPGVDDTTPMPSAMLVEDVKVETDLGR